MKDRCPRLQSFLNIIRDKINPNAKDGHCIQCNEPFSDKNVHSEAGWRETKLSQQCEDCWDKIMRDLHDQNHNKPSLWQRLVDHFVEDLHLARWQVEIVWPIWFTIGFVLGYSLHR